MTQDTKTKFAAILAAAQAKGNDKAKPNFSEPIAPKQPEPIQAALNPIPDPVQPVKLAKMQSFTIIWHEGTGDYDGKSFTNWHEANAVLLSIYNEHEGPGYTKVKVCIKWENGAEITDRIDCGDSGNDYSGDIPVGEYLGSQNSAMYESNFKVYGRDSVQWKDDNDPTAYAYMKKNGNLNGFKEPEQPKNGLKIVDYSDKAFAVIGETKPIKEVLRSLGGRFNNFLTCGPGWIFAKTRYEAVKVSLSL